MNYALLMPGAGSGSRLGASLPKSLLPLAGRALFVHAVEPFLQDPRCREAVVAAPAGYEAEYEREAALAFGPGRVRVVTGGRTRQESVFLAAASVAGPVDALLMHDAARPLVTGELIDRVIAPLAEGFAGSVPGLPVVDTIKRISSSPAVVEATVDRAALVAVQTPQALQFTLAMTAFELARRAGYEGTDDVSLLEHFALGPVRVVDGAPRNFKITTREDLERARELLEREAELHRRES